MPPCHASYPGDGRPGFLARLRRVALRSAELTAAAAPERLEALAEFVGALRGPLTEGSRFLAALDYLLNRCVHSVYQQATQSTPNSIDSLLLVRRSDLNTKGEQSGGDAVPFLPTLVARWLADSSNAGTVAGLERHIYGAWAVAAAGGARADAMMDPEALGRLAAFPDALQLHTGVVTTDLPADAPLRRNVSL